MSEQEYEYQISRIREIILDSLCAVEIAFEEIKNVTRETSKHKLSENLLQLLLLVAHTKEGRKLFIEVLEYVKTYNAELALKYWNVFDDIENLVKNKYFTVTINPS